MATPSGGAAPLKSYHPKPIEWGDRLVPWLLVLVGAMLFYEALVGSGSFYMRDILYHYAPSKFLIRQRWLDGQWPLWTHGYALGGPLLADPGVGALYPGNLLLLLPWPYGMDLFLLAHVALAGPGTYWLMRRLDVSVYGASAGGLAFMLSGYLTSMTLSGTYLVSAAWMPWVLWGFLRASEPTSGARQVTEAGALLALQALAGDPQAVFMTLLLVVSLGPFVASGRCGRLFAVVAVSGAIAGLLSLVQYLPAAGLLYDRPRGQGISLLEAEHWSFHPLRMIEFLVPGAFGDFRSPSHFFGYFLNDEGTGLPVDPWAPQVYLGAAILLVPAAWSQRASRRRATGLLLIGLATLTLAIGQHGPIFGVFHTHFPLANLFRYPEKYLLTTSLCGAALIGLAVERALESEPSLPARVPSWLLPGTLWLGVLLLATGWSAAGSEPIAGWLAAKTPALSAQRVGDELVLAISRAAGLSAAVLAPVLLFRTGYLSRRVAALLLMISMSVDLLAVGRNITEFIPPDMLQQPYGLTQTLVAANDGLPPRVYRPQGLPFMRGKNPRFRSPGEIAALEAATLAPNIGNVHGVEYALGYTATLPGPLDRLHQRLRSQPRRLLDLLGADYFVHPISDELPPELQVVHEDEISGLSLVRNHSALPRVYVATAPQVAADLDDALDLLSDEHFIPGRDVVVEGPVPALSEPLEMALPCALRQRSPEHLVAECDAPSAGFAVVVESMARGWKAYVDGVAVPIRTANLTQRAVPLPAGHHRLEMRYTPSEFVFGATISLLTWAALLAFLVLARQRSVAA